MLLSTIIRDRFAIWFAAMQALTTYRQLLAKVDAKFAEIQAAHPTAFQCRAGCHACCLPGLTVSPIERENLSAFIVATPNKEAELRELKASNPYKGSRCSLLKSDGSCSVYEARPIVCRSHGAPIRVKTETESRLDVCPLNFAETSLDEIPSSDTINLETLNTILALINQQFAGAGATNRVALSIDGLLAEDVHG